MRYLLPRQPERLLADELGDLRLDREVGALLRREVERPLGQEPDELLAQLADAVAGLRADRVQRVEVAEPAAAVCICVAMWPGFRRSTLLTAITTGTPSAKTRVAMKRSPAPIRSRASTTNSTASTSSNEESTVRCMRSVSGSSGRWKPGRSASDELVVVAVRDPEDAPPGRLRLVGDDRHLPAAERVHERRLADVRPAGDGDEAGSHRTKVSGSSSSGVYSTSSPSLRAKITRSTSNSTCHWRQPPHGEALITIRSKSPGLYPAVTAAT